MRGVRPPVIAALLAPSPLAPLRDHMRAALRVARQVPRQQGELTRGVSDGGSALLEAEKAAREARGLALEVRRRARPFRLLPLDGAELLDALRHQEAVVRAAHGAVRLAALRGKPPPETAGPALRRLAEVAVVACEQATHAFDALDPLLEVGFAGRLRDPFLTGIARGARLAPDLRRATEEARSALHAAEPALGAAVFWDRIARETGAAGRRALAAAACLGRAVGS